METLQTVAASAAPAAPVAPVPSAPSPRVSAEKLSDAFIQQTFEVPLSVHLLSGLADSTFRFWKRVGDLETKSLSDSLQDVTVDRPIYIAGLARSGTTILLEALSKHEQVATHCYRDFPFLCFPHWWNQSQSDKAHETATERAHGDGILITPDSPEAMEEVLWQKFFPQAHDSTVSNVLDASHQHPEFESFYREHIRKLLLLRNRPRYVAKGNYNLTRLAYLHKMLPDARFVVPIRRPEAHIASLMKQQELFSRGERKFPRALAHMRRVGHYEFGLDRRVINVGDPETVEQIEKLWQSGDEVRGWAKYWAHLYGPLLREATHLVRYEDLCSDAHTTLNSIREHVRLDPSNALTMFADQIHPPSYYQSGFSDDDVTIIKEETVAVAEKYGYS